MKCPFACCLLVLSLTACGEDADSAATDPFDPCSVVTQPDATALFGKPAVRDQGALITDPAYLGDCIWTHEPPDVLGSQTVALYLWQGEDYYAPRPEAVAFEIGDAGSIYQDASTGIDIDWVQDQKTAMLSYFTVGESVPDALSKVEEVKALALAASGRF